MKTINLIPKSRREAIRSKRRTLRWGFICGGYVAVIVGTFIVLHLLRDDTQALSAEISRITQSMQDCEGTVTSLRPQVVESQAVLEAAKAIADQPDWSVLLALLGKSVGNEVWLNWCQVEPAREAEKLSRGPLPPAALAAQQQQRALPGQGHYVVRLGGFGASQKAVSQFVVRLEESGLFDRVQLIKSDRQTEHAEDSTAFRVECTLGGREP